MAVAPLNIARLNGPFAEHSLGNLLNARKKAVDRLANPRLAMTHNANRTLRNAINRHLELRRNRSRRVDEEALERRRMSSVLRAAAGLNGSRKATEEDPERKKLERQWNELRRRNTARNTPKSRRRGTRRA